LINLLLHPNQRKRTARDNGEHPTQE